MRFSIKLKESNTEISNRIVREMRKKAQPVLSKGFGKIQKALPKLIKQRIEEEPIWQSILNGRLRQELGLRFPEKRLDNLMKEILSERSLKFELSLNGPKFIIGKMGFYAIPSDYENLLNSLNSSYYSVSKKGKEKIEWAKYVLVQGSKPIFFNTRIQYFQKQNRKSRAGFALMKPAPGEIYSLNEGTQNNNFLKSSMKDLESRLTNIFKLILLGVL